MLIVDLLAPKGVNVNNEIKQEWSSLSYVTVHGRKENCGTRVGHIIS